MKYSIASFQEVVEGVKQETGIKDLSNMYQDIIQMMSRAERDINPYSGFFVRKKVRLHKGTKFFDGRNIKKPFDFVELDSVGTCNEGICPGSYRENISHIILCDGKKRQSVVISYYTLNCDGFGYPVTTHNHLEAVIAFIVWKLYSQLTFMGQGNFNVKRHYQQNYEDFCMASRGHDAMPNDHELEIMSRLNHMPKHRLMNFVNGVDVICCDGVEIEDYGKPEEDKNPEEPMKNKKVYFGQIKGPKLVEMSTSLAQKIIDIKTQDDSSRDALDRSDYDINQISLHEAMVGYTYPFQMLGRYFFFIDDVDDNSVEVYDLLYQSMGDSLDKIYDVERRRLILYSENYITPSNIYFKMIYNEG